mgnify:FL=1
MRVTDEKDLQRALDGFLLDTFEAYGNDAGLFMKLQQKVASKTVSDLTNLTNICIYSVLPEEYQTEKDALLAYRLPPNDFGRWYYAMCRANDKLNYPSNEGDEATELNWTKMQLKTAVIERFPYENFKTTSNKKKTINKKLLAELQSTGLLFADVTKIRLYIMSRYALPTLGQRVRASGDFLLESTFARDILLMSLFANSKMVKFIVRVQDKLSKIFMVTTTTYNELPLTMIEQLYFMFAQASGFTGMTCDGWLLNHSISCIRFSFDNNTVIDELRTAYEEELETFDYTYGLDVLPKPGIEIKSSDIGDCAFIVRGYWKFPHTILYTEEVARKHSGKFTSDDLITEVKNTIFSRYTELPKALIKLLRVEITPESISEVFRNRERLDGRIRTLQMTVERLEQAPDTEKEQLKSFKKELANCTKEYTRMDNDMALAIKKHKTLLENIVLTTLHRVKSGTYATKKAWRDRIIDKLDPTGIYTAYDLVCAILDTPFEGSAESEEKTQKAISGLPYLDYEEILSKVLSKRRVRAGKKNRKKPDEADDFAADGQDVDDDGAISAETPEDPDPEDTDQEADDSATD